jgi:hypothetical protein
MHAKLLSSNPLCFALTHALTRQALAVKIKIKIKITWGDLQPDCSADRML